MTEISMLDKIQQATIARDVSKDIVTVFIKSADKTEDLPIHIKSPSMSLREKLIEKCKDKDGNFNVLKFNCLAMINLVCHPDDPTKTLFQEGNLKELMDTTDVHTEWYKTIMEAVEKLLYPAIDEESHDERKKVSGETQ